MSVRRKLGLLAVVAVAVSAVPAALLGYRASYDDFLEAARARIEAEAAVIAATHSERLADAGRALPALAEQLHAALVAPPVEGEADAMRARLRRDPDGAWRTPPIADDAPLRAGVFMPPDAGLDDEHLRFLARTTATLDVAAVATTAHFVNVWVLTPERDEVIYDTVYRNFVHQMAADNDYRATPWWTMASPQENPGRTVRWTPALYDPVPGQWMVSAIVPIDVDGRWVGVLGFDLHLDRLLGGLLEPAESYEGTHHFLIDADGGFVLAGPWQHELESDPAGALNREDLDAGLAAVLTDSGETSATFLGHRHLVARAQFGPTGWSYYRLVRESEVMAPVRSLFVRVAFTIALAGVVSMVLIVAASNRWVVRPVRRLRDVVARWGTGDSTARVGPAASAGGGEVAELSRVFDAMADKHVADEAEREALYAEVSAAHLEAVVALAEAIDARDATTADHSKRLSRLAVLVGRQMGLGHDECRVLAWAGLLHDIGKLAVPDAVLRKPGRLSAAERRLVQSHPERGAQIVAPLRVLGSAVAPLIIAHHERVDGTGYPHGIAGDEIPLGARILAVADSYDAIIGERAYRPGRSHAEALAELRRCAGTQFDPAVVEAFVRVCDAEGFAQGFDTPIATAELAADLAPEMA